MSDYSGLKQDWNETVTTIRQRGLAASLSRYVMIGGVAAGAVMAGLAVNYGAPMITQAIAELVEADISLISGDAREAYGRALLQAVDNLAGDVDALAEWLWAPIEANWTHFKNGTLVDYHKDWIENIRIFEFPVGKSFLDTWKWALTPDHSSHTLVGRHFKPACGIVAGLGMTVLASRAAIHVTGKSVNSPRPEGRGFRITRQPGLPG